MLIIASRKRIAGGGEGPGNIDALHRQILDGMLAKPEWEAPGKMWGEEKRREVNLVWHRLNGAFPFRYPSDELTAGVLGQAGPTRRPGCAPSRSTPSSAHSRTATCDCSSTWCASRTSPSPSR